MPDGSESDAPREAPPQRDPNRPAPTPEEMRERLNAITGTWKNRAKGKSTDETMKELRGDD